MLISFEMKNYKSFYDETEINMVADNSKSEKRDCLFTINDNNRVKKNILPSMVIYGENASGKTTIIDAMNSLKTIILNGTISKIISNIVIDKLEISTFIHDENKRREPIEFEITFKTKKNIYNYLIKFMTYPSRKILKENLDIVKYAVSGNSVKKKIINIYNRNENNVIFNKNSRELRDIIDVKNIKNYSAFEKTLSGNIDKEILFINIYKNINPELCNDFINWFKNELVTIIDFSAINFNLNLNGEVDEKHLYENIIIKKLIKKSDFGPQSIGFVKNNEKGKFIMTSIYKPTNAKGAIAIDSKLVESKGTIRLINFWLIFIDIFKRGGTLVLDEFDSSIHPELIGRNH